MVTISKTKRLSTNQFDMKILLMVFQKYQLFQTASYAGFTFEVFALESR